jgi:hypothetical protein
VVWESAPHRTTNSNHLFPLTRVAFCHLALASPLSCPQPPFLPPGPDYRTHRTTRDKAPPKGRPFSPPPLEVHEWDAAVMQGVLYAPPRLRTNGALPYSPFAECGKVRDPPPPPPPYCTLTPPPFAPCPPVCARTGLAPESRRGRAAAPFTPFLCVAPAPFCAPPFVHEQIHADAGALRPAPAQPPAVCGGAEGM